MISSYKDNSIGKGYIDIHCHCLSGVDDGPATKAEALALCQALVEDGVTTVIATPHQLGRFSDCNEATQIRDNVSVFNEELKANNIPLTTMPGLMFEWTKEYVICLKRIEYLPSPMEASIFCLSFRTRSL